MLTHHPVSLSLTESSPTQQSDTIQSLYSFSIQSQFISLNHLPPNSHIKYKTYCLSIQSQFLSLNHLPHNSQLSTKLMQLQHSVSVLFTELYPTQQPSKVQSLCCLTTQSQFISLNDLPPNSHVGTTFMLPHHPVSFYLTESSPTQQPGKYKVYVASTSSFSFSH